MRLDARRDHHRTRRAGFVALLCAVSVIAWEGLLHGQAREPIEPIPLHQDLDPRKVMLGEGLFGDPRLSEDGKVACTSCHLLNRGGADVRPLSIGAEGRAMSVNTLTVFNSALNFPKNWEGNADSLDAQLGMVVHDDRILNTTWPRLIARLSADTALVSKFQKVYPDGVTQATITDALTTYEQSLTTPNAQFDRWLRGDAAALKPDELAGYQLFKGYGCVSCHQGVNVGGNMFQVLGVVGERGAYFTARGHITNADYGRFNVTGAEADRFVFRVPSLRNVALTAPYLHDGSAATLPDVVRIMFKYQLGRTADQHDVDLIVKFLHTLTGEYQGKPLDADDPTRSGQEAARR